MLSRLKLFGFAIFLFATHLLNKNLDNLDRRHCQRFTWQYSCDFAYANDGDGAIADFYNQTPFNPDEVLPGNTVFVTNQSVRSFFKDIHPKIKSPYILVMWTGILPDFKYLDDTKIIAFFCTDQGPVDPTHTLFTLNSYNLEPASHKKMILIPIGIYREKRLSYYYKNIDQLCAFLRSKPKEKLLHMDFSLHDFSPLRSAVYNMYKDKPWVKDECKRRKPFEKYLQEMAECKFTLSPQGDMNDCYRHWEAILCGVIPIIQRTSINTLLEDLPVLLIDKWSEINEDFLNQKYIAISSKKYNLEKLYMKFWVNKIDKVKNDFLSIYLAEKKINYYKMKSDL